MEPRAIEVARRNGMVSIGSVRGRGLRGRLGGAFLLNPQDAAPSLVFGNGHSAFNANPNALRGWGLAEQLIEKAHRRLSGEFELWIRRSRRRFRLRSRTLSFEQPRQHALTAHVPR